MPYNPTNWVNGGPPGISAERLNKIEQGIKDAHDGLDVHIANTNNPHNVTKSQVGLGSVQNYGIASQEQAEAGSSNSVYMTPLRTKNYVDVRLQNNLQFRMNAGVVEYNDGGGWKPVGGVKSVQRGEATIAEFNQTINVTISPVNLNKAFVNLNFVIGDSSVTLNAMLTSATNLRINKAGSQRFSSPYGVAWEVIEFY